MNELITEQFQSHQIRRIMIDDQPWWVAADVCRVLDIQNVTEAVNGKADRGGTGLEDDEKLTKTLSISGQNRAVWLVNEPGLYSLILKSRKPEAKAFKRWITHDILPAIRRTGIYAIPKSRELQVAEALIAANSLIQEQKQKLIEQQPKVEVYERFMDAKGGFTIRQTAKLLSDYGQNRLFKRLREMGVLMRNNEPKQQYIDQGYFGVFNNPIKIGNEFKNHIQAIVYPKGLVWLAKKLSVDISAPAELGEAS